MFDPHNKKQIMSEVMQKNGSIYSFHLKHRKYFEIITEKPRIIHAVFA